MPSIHPPLRTSKPRSLPPAGTLKSWGLPPREPSRPVSPVAEKYSMPSNAVPDQVRINVVSGGKRIVEGGLWVGEPRESLWKRVMSAAGAPAGGGGASPFSDCDLWSSGGGGAPAGGPSYGGGFFSSDMGPSRVGATTSTRMGGDGCSSEEGMKKRESRDLASRRRVDDVECRSRSLRGKFSRRRTNQ